MDKLGVSTFTMADGTSAVTDKNRAKILLTFFDTMSRQAQTDVSGISSWNSAAPQTSFAGYKCKRGTVGIIKVLRKKK